jgi:hypothetical protein
VQVIVVKNAEMGGNRRIFDFRNGRSHTNAARKSVYGVEIILLSGRKKTVDSTQVLNGR